MGGGGLVGWSWTRKPEGWETWVQRRPGLAATGSGGARVLERSIERVERKTQVEGIHETGDWEDAGSDGFDVT